MLIAAAGIVSAVCADDHDQYWLSGAVKWKATDQVSLKLKEQVRFRDETHYYRYTELGIGYQFNKSWSLGSAYRYVSIKDKAGDWLSGNGFLLDPVNTLNGFGVELKTRMRVFYFDPNFDADSVTDVRPKFTLLPQNGFSAWKVKPFVADEIMYNFDIDQLYRNRLSFGLICKPHENLYLDIFAMHERIEIKDAWAENWNYGLGVTLSI